MTTNTCRQTVSTRHTDYNTDHKGWTTKCTHKEEKRCVKREWHYWCHLTLWSLTKFFCCLFLCFFFFFNIAQLSMFRACLHVPSPLQILLLPPCGYLTTLAYFHVTIERTHANVFCGKMCFGHNSFCCLEFVSMLASWLQRQCLYQPLFSSLLLHTEIKWKIQAKMLNQRFSKQDMEPRRGSPNSFRGGRRMETKMCFISYETDFTQSIYICVCDLVKDVAGW